jgi:outer membrane protein TolC
MQSPTRRDRGRQARVDEIGDAQDVRARFGDDDIARRAYERYEARGRTDGYALDDWLDAERELRSAERSDNAEGSA